jgi:hypothetical protein
MTRGYAEAGYPEALRLAARSRVTYVRPFVIAALYGWAAKKDQAFEWLENALEARDHDMVYLSVQTLPDAIRNDPRFQDLLGRMNLPQ